MKTVSSILVAALFFFTGLGAARTHTVKTTYSDTSPCALLISDQYDTLIKAVNSHSAPSALEWFQWFPDKAIHDCLKHQKDLPPKRTQEAKVMRTVVHAVRRRQAVNEALNGFIGAAGNTTRQLQHQNSSSRTCCAPLPGDRAGEVVWVPVACPR